MPKQAKKTKRATKTQPEKRKPGRPTAFSDETLEEIKYAYSHAVPMPTIVADFNISKSQVYRLAQKYNWPKPKEFIQKVAEAADVETPTGKDVLNKVSGAIFAKEADRYVSVVQRLTARIMDEIEARPPDVQNWRDVEIVDKMGRRARGLDVADTRQNVLVNVGSLMSDPDSEL